MNKNEIFVIGSWVDSKVKEQNLIEVIKDLKGKGYPVCLVAHYPISNSIQELVDYYIYEKENVLGDYRLTFWRIINGVREETQSTTDYHGVACLMNILNAVDLIVAKGKYKYIHYREADVIYDFNKYMETFQKMVSENKQALFLHYQDNAYRTDIFSCDINWFDPIIPEPQSWEEYKKLAISGNVILEYWFTEWVRKNTNEDQIIFLKDFKVGNKWTHSANAEWEPNTRLKLDFADAPVSLQQSTNRKDSFMKILTLLYNNKKELNPNIVEVGVTRKEGSISDGDSTSIWAWYITKYGGSYHGCDISKDNTAVCEQILRKYISGTDKITASDKATYVAVTTKDGIEFLKDYNKPIDLAYLDSIDWVKGSDESKLFHLRLLLEVMNKIKVGGYVMFDDTFNMNTYEGKAELAIPYLLGGNNFTCVFRGYQFIFRRDI